MIKIIRTDIRNEDFQLLITELDADLAFRYSTEQEKFNHHNQINYSANVVVAYSDAEAIGCGCLRAMEEESTAEIKRMYVKSSFRGQGVSKLILKELEDWAKEEKYTKTKLETGIKQPEAISLYTKSGYSTTEKYGPYKHIPESVCMEKTLI